MENKIEEKIIIYHNSRCRKSRQTLELLKEKTDTKNIQIIEYLKNPPTKEELENIIKLLQITSIELIRKNELEYKNLKSNQGIPNETQAIEWMLKYPKLMERPIVINQNKAKIGRPPEAVLEILE